MAFLDQNYLIKNHSGAVIFDRIRNLPVIDPHNHADVREIADNQCYSDAWQLFAATDHYVWEMLRKCSVPEEFITGKRSPREKFLMLANVFPLIVGNPVYEWIHLDLRRYFGIEELLCESSGERIYNAVNAKLATDAFRPQALLTGPLNVEAMSSTDDLVDTLENHDRANRAFGRTLLHPTWRPDRAMRIWKPDWREYMGVVEKRFGIKLNGVKDLFAALRLSHEYFAERGCRASDHGLEIMVSADASTEYADAAFRKAMSGAALSRAEIDGFMGRLMVEVGELNSETGWVTQLHLGAVRDVRRTLFDSLGADVGGDVSDHFQPICAALCSFLNHFDDRLKTVLYCLEPGHSATLATVARAFGAKVALGSAWWLCDNPVGMRRQLEYIGSVDLLNNFAGMVSDSRKLLSYGSRFEMFRRVLADVLGDLVERGQIPSELVHNLAANVAYHGPKRFWTL